MTKGILQSAGPRQEACEVNTKACSPQPPTRYQSRCRSLWTRHDSIISTKTT